LASRAQIAKPDIIQTFETLPKILKLRDIESALNEHRKFWRLTNSTTVKDFVNFLREKTQLVPITIPFPQRAVVGFTWGPQPLLEVLLGLAENSFLSHYTAMRIHGLTEQVPKTVYLNQEKNENSATYSSHEKLFDQPAIDSAFLRPPRHSQNMAEYEGTRILFLQSAYHAGLGITSSDVNLGGDRDLTLRHTTLERTLIDIVVRPFYAGGVFEVAKAFEQARTTVSVNTMAAMLKKLGHGYPYHQAIGYYLERAGYRPGQVDLFRKIPRERDFYLTHQMAAARYVEAWRLYVPEGF